MRKFLILFLIGFSLTAQAVTIIPLQETFLQKVFRCKWRVSCYRQNLGATITTINATDLIKDSRATINTNFTNLNNGKIENSTTSVASITTLSNLVTVGALSSGSLASGFTTVSIGLGGTGSTTLSANQVLLGNGTTALKVVSGFGTTGQFLTSQGNATAPIWSSATFDTTAITTVTGLWTFSAGFSSGTSTIGSLHATSTLNVSGDMQVGGTATTTQNGNLEVNKNLIVDKSARVDTLRVVTGCEGCGINSQSVEVMNSCDGTNGVTCSQQVTCPTGTKAVGGGHSATSSASLNYTLVMSKKATTSEGWRVITKSQDAGNVNYNLTAMAVCL